MRFASATSSSALLFSRLAGLFGNGRIEPGEKIDALQPFPTGQTSIRYPLESMTVIFSSAFRATVVPCRRRQMLPGVDAVADDAAASPALLSCPSPAAKYSIKTDCKAR